MGPDGSAATAAQPVRMPPGSTMATLTPDDATSFARTSEKPSTANFAV